ncbi:ABC transporter ATP-binding protein [Dictyoglomus thermophilum]|uniref:ATP-binding cassette domain-containing protein n=1 Tax=Dictyoglomus thermophilum TaxID=14 RepID=UPI0011EA7D91|nr:ABC transporter ATP-binding protein [Dictyoglomus thermophilum]TYT20332.1 ABC transporter ATP-binding protein [Dictyoglomus thermophilum]
MNFSNIKKVFKFYSLLSPLYLFGTFLGGFLVNFEVIVGFLFPILTKSIIDSLTLKIINWQAIFYLGFLYLLSLILMLIGEQVYIKNKYLAAFDLMNKIFSKSFFFPVKKLKEQGSAYYSTLILNQVNEAFGVLDYSYIRNIIVIFRMFFIMGIVFIWDRIFFLLFLINILIVAFYSEVINKKTQSYYSKGYEILRRAGSYIVETFENLHEIFAGEGIEKRKKGYKELTDEFINVGLSAEFIRARLDKLLVELPEYLSRLFIFVYGGILIASGKMTVGTILAILTYYSYITEPLYLFRSLVQVTVKLVSNFDTIFKFFEEAQEYEKMYEDGRILIRENSPIYSLKDVAFFYDERPVLKNINFEVVRGDRVAILGLSGEGKTTLLNILLGIEKDYQGEVEFLGNDIRKISPIELFKYIGYYSQQVGIFNDTLENNIILGREYNKKRLEWVIKELGLEHLRGRVLGEEGSFISGGEKQRVQLARLLYGNKDIFIIDEPLVNLDVINENFLLEKLKDFIIDKSGILITHKPNILRLANKIIVLMDGSIVGVGPLNELVKSNPLCKKIIETYLESAKELRDEINRK